MKRTFMSVPGESRREYAFTRLRVEAGHPAMRACPTEGRILTRFSLERVKTYS